MASYNPMRDMERLAENLLGTVSRGPRQMPMDLYRDQDHYVLTADLPGIDPGSVDIDIDGQLLTIRAERTLPAGDDVKWITRERTPGSFLRQLSLGQGIDSDNISASYDNGVLSVMIPVSERAKPRKVQVMSTRTVSDSSALTGKGESSGDAPAENRELNGASA